MTKIITKTYRYFIKKWQKHINYKIKQKTLQMAGEKKSSTIINFIWRTSFLLIMAIIIAFPFYWMVITSFKTDDELDPTKLPTIWPQNWTIKSYQDLLGSNSLSVGKFIFNSFLVAFLSTILKLVICSIAAFGLSYYNSRFREFFFIIMLATMMIPGEAIIIGQLIFILQIHWDESLAALVIPFVASVFTVYMLRQAFDSIPVAVYNSAKVDGANPIKIFLTIALPLIKPTLWKSAIISFIASWNSILWPTIVLESDSRWATIPMLLWQLTKITGNDELNTTTLMDPQNLKMAGAVITVAPMLILYLVAKKQIIKGITKDGGTKG